MGSEQQAPKLPRIVVAKLEPAVEPSPEMRVLYRGSLRLPGAKMPGHTEVDDEAPAVLSERHHDVLAAPLDGGDRLPAQSPAEGPRRGIADHPGQRRRITPELDGHDPATAELWAEITNDGLNFRKFRHRAPL